VKKSIIYEFTDRGKKEGFFSPGENVWWRGKKGDGV